jgi:hypothetical protein
VEESRHDLFTSTYREFGRPVIPSLICEDLPAIARSVRNEFLFLGVLFFSDFSAPSAPRSDPLR